MAGMKKGRSAAVIARDGGRCRKCGAAENLTADHIRPRAVGGTQAMDNLQCLCEECNVRRGLLLTRWCNWLQRYGRGATPRERQRRFEAFEREDGPWRELPGVGGRRRGRDAHRGDG